MTVSKLKDVLVVAYYFPPMGGSGVQRISKFVKYLPDFGWQPHVLTINPHGYQAYDETLLTELEDRSIPAYRTTSRDITRLWGRKKTVNMPRERRRRKLAELSQWLFIPDNKIGWKGPAIKRGKVLLEYGSFKAILATAPPYSAAQIAQQLGQATGLPFVVDFRDDWVGNPRHTYPTAWHKKKHASLEEPVVKEAKGLITINDRIASAIESRHQGHLSSGAVDVIPQGFDQEDLNVAPIEKPNGKMRWVYSGMFYDRQTPEPFLKALAYLRNHAPDVSADIEAVFVGLAPERIREKADAFNLGDKVKTMGYRPHQEAISFLLSADLLWMTIGEGPGQETISTSKLYEYFGTKKPILGLVPQGAAADAIREYGAGVIAPPNDVAAIATAMKQLHALWKEDALPKPQDAFVEQHDRRKLTGELARVLDRVAFS